VLFAASSHTGKLHAFVSTLTCQPVTSVTTSLIASMPTSAHNDDHPHNVGSADALLERHSVHASVAQTDAVGGPLANADGLPCSNASTHVAKLKRATLRRRSALLRTHRDKRHKAPAAPCRNGITNLEGTARSAPTASKGYSLTTAAPHDSCPKRTIHTHRFAAMPRDHTRETRLAGTGWVRVTKSQPVPVPAGTRRLHLRGVTNP
jgi:hypothetical protein